MKQNEFDKIYDQYSVFDLSYDRSLTREQNFQRVIDEIKSISLPGEKWDILNTAAINGTITTMIGRRKDISRN